ncbi:bestrophin family protein [Neisseriaceae bacterium B1]
MIVRNKTNSFALLFAWRGTILPRVLPIMLGLSLLSVLLAWVAHHKWFEIPTPPVVGFTILGVVMSIFLGFRNNASYDRWWEGRKLWGLFIATQRHLARDTQMLSNEKRELVLQQVIVFANLLRDRLRYQTAHPELFLEYGKMDAEKIEAFSRHINPPQFCLEHIQSDLILALKQQEISDISYKHLTEHINTLGAIQAGCDRIASTPLPFAYSVLFHRAVYSFCIMLPFALDTVLGFWTPLMVAWLVYLFLGLDALSIELEEPFGLQDNDLPLDTMVNLIERELLTSLGREVEKAGNKSAMVLT